ncbi:MAG: response regulator [Treponema sp.]|nr:response regulator [Treponema sp.]
MGKLIFIVDDNDANLTMAASALDNDYKVLTMPSAEKMFNLLEKKRPDLILLDVEMPEMSGLEAIVKLKENSQYSDIPVLFLTGWTDDELLSNAKKSGALAVISKPIVQSVLMDYVKKYI